MGQIPCECGEYTGEKCSLMADGTVVEYMPEHLRVSHLTAGPGGMAMWPHDGSVRLQINADCADWDDSGNGWLRVVSSQDSATYNECHEDFHADG
jgi:hypothetical protein